MLILCESHKLTGSLGRRKIRGTGFSEASALVLPLLFEVALRL
jgi:hypothetical protein